MFVFNILWYLVNALVSSLKLISKCCRKILIDPNSFGYENETLKKGKKD